APDDRRPIERPAQCETRGDGERTRLLSPKRELDLEPMQLRRTLTESPLASEPSLELGPDAAGSKPAAQNRKQDIASDVARPCHCLLEQEVLCPRARIDRPTDARPSR